MSTPIAVVTSDNHLKPYNWARYPSLWGDSYYSFQQIREYCQNKALSLMLGGDVIDTRYPDPFTVGFLFDQLHLLEYQGLPTYFIQGQHEMSRDRPWLSCCPNSHSIFHLHRNPASFGSFRAYGIDFTSSSTLPSEFEVLKDTAKDLDRIKVLVAHQPWAELMGERHSKDKLADVPWVDMVITGDFHAHKSIKVEASDGRAITVLSPGSTYLKTLDEDPRKFFFVLNDDLSFTSVKLDTRAVIKARLGTINDLDQAIYEIEQLGPKYTAEWQIAGRTVKAMPVWHVEYYDSIPDALIRLQEAADGLVHLFDRPVLTGAFEEPEQPAEGLVVESERSLGLETCLSLTVAEDHPVHSTARRLLQAANHGDVKAEIKQIEKETLAESTQQTWSNEVK